MMMKLLSTFITGKFHIAPYTHTHSKKHPKNITKKYIE